MLFPRVTLQPGRLRDTVTAEFRACAATQWRSCTQERCAPGCLHAEGRVCCDHCHLKAAAIPSSADTSARQVSLLAIYNSRNRWRVAWTFFLLGRTIMQ